jgi:hypothetical protein
MLIKELAKQVKVASGGVKASLTSDAYTGTVVAFTGWNNILAIVTTATPSTSVATLTVSFQKNVVTDISSDAASTDWAAIASDCSLVAATYAASTSVYQGIVDIKIPSSDSSGMIRASVLTPGEGLTIDGLAITYLLYGGSDIRPNTDYTYTTWPV